MDPNTDDGRKVRLKTRRLAQLMGERGWTAHRLHLMAGEPSKRTINRWLQRGQRTSDGIVPTEWRYVVAVADAMGVPAHELVDVAPAGEHHGAERFLRLAAGLGPRVYPDLMRTLGFPATLEEVNALGTYLEPVGGDPEEWRFARWAHVEDILRDDTYLPKAFARKALAWAERQRLGVTDAPALHCLCAIALDDVEGAWEAGFEWMKAARRRGVLAETAWIGDRLRAIEGADERISIDVRAEVLFLLARALSLGGGAYRALDLLSDFSLSLPLRRRPVLRGRLHVELARVRSACGQVRAALEAAREAVESLSGLEEDSRVAQYLFEALMERTYLCERLGDFDDMADVMAAMGRLIRRPHGEPIARFYRLLGIGALVHGDVRAALEHFLTCLDVALAEGDMREAGVARLHIAIGFALTGDAERAQAYFEQAVAHVASGEAGPLLVATVHQNFGEFCLEQGRTAAARRHLRIALGQYAEAGEFASLEAVCHTLLAEVAVSEGDLTEARRLARLAHKQALVAENPLHEAQALSAYALAHLDDPVSAEEWGRAAMEILARIPDGFLVLDRVVVERRCAEARYRASGDPDARDELERLVGRADEMGLRVEVRRIARLLSHGEAETTHA
ncbi:MAG: hypothetical protein ACQEXJ_12320 [Myxococcota bacterium]